jgi:hypothetical protein
VTQVPNRPDNAERFLAYIRLFFPHILEITFLDGRLSPPGFLQKRAAWRTRYPSAPHLALFRYRAELGVEHHSIEDVLALTKAGAPGRKALDPHSKELGGFLGDGRKIGKRAIEEMCRGLEATEEQTRTLVAFANTDGSKPLNEQRANEIYDELVAAARAETPGAQSPVVREPEHQIESPVVREPEHEIETSATPEARSFPEQIPPGWRPYEPPVGEVISRNWWRHPRTALAAVVLVLVVVLVLATGMGRSREMRGQALPESGFTPVVSDPSSRATTTLPTAPRPNAKGQPLEFTVEPYAQGSCGAYVFPGVKNPAALGSPPSYSENFGGWLNKLGGISTEFPAGGPGAGLVLITLQAPTTKKVVVTGVRAEVTKHDEPADGVVIKNPCGSSTPGRAVKFDGDTQPPSIVDSTDGVVEVNGVNVRTEQLTLPIQVSADEPETLYVTMTTNGTVEWKLHLDWSAGMDLGTTTFDNYGQPFRTAAVIAGAPAYTFTDAGWNPK